MPRPNKTTRKKWNMLNPTPEECVIICVFAAELGMGVGAYLNKHGLQGPRAAHQGASRSKSQVV